MKPLLAEFKEAIGRTITDVALSGDNSYSEPSEIAFHFSDGTALIVGVDFGYERDWRLIADTDPNYSPVLNLLSQEERDQMEQSRIKRQEEERRREEARLLAEYQRLKRKYEP